MESLPGHRVWTRGYPQEEESARAGSGIPDRFAMRLVSEVMFSEMQLNPYDFKSKIGEKRDV
jgi:hypothetical protein